MVNALKIWWSRLSRLPGGRWFFGKIVGFLIPYTGSVSPRVVQLRPGFAEVAIKDRRSHRNHLRSIHALALSNLGEFTTGLAVHFAMQSDDRAILTRLDSQFLKKARGRIRAIAEATIPPMHEKGTFVVEARLFDEAENLVATVSATWLLGKINSPKTAKS